MKSILPVILLLGSFSSAFAAEELNKVIQCHEAMDGKSSGTTSKLNLDSATPILLKTAEGLYFYTDTSVGFVKNTFQGKTVVFHLKNAGKDFYRQISFKADGSVGAMAYDVLKNPKDAVETSVRMDEKSLGLLKADLARQVNAMSNEYQNKFDLKNTLESLRICGDIDTPEMKKAVQKQTAYYESLQKKSKYSKDGEKTKGSK